MPDSTPKSTLPKAILHKPGVVDNCRNSDIGYAHSYDDRAVDRNARPEKDTVVRSHDFTFTQFYIADLDDWFCMVRN